MLTRRAVFGFSLVAAAPARPVLSIGPSDSLRREATLWLPSGAAFTCPAKRARLLAVLRLKAMDISAVGFAADAETATQDLIAFVGPDGVLLALERLYWKATNGDELTTRFAMLPDRVHITLERSAAVHRTGWLHEGWTDYLELDAGQLCDRPPRPVMPATWQSRLAAERAAIAATLSRAQTLLPATCRSFAETPFA